MPQTKSVIKGKSTAQENTLSCDELGRVQDFFGGRLQVCSFLRIRRAIFAKILLSFMFISTLPSATSHLLRHTAS